MPVTELKKDMRRTAKAARGRAFTAHGPHASETIAGHGIGFAGRPAPAVVSGFLAIGEEIDPSPLMRRLIGEGYRLCLPVMEGKGKPLVFRAWSPGEPLAETMWGIREPLPEAPALDPDIVLGPLLAFDAAGYRLGYGGGFYDRLLPLMRPEVAVAAGAFDEQIVDAVPTAGHDRRVPLVVTPTRVIAVAS